MNPLTPILWFAPAYIANASATLSKLLPKTTPIDGRKTFIDGRRLLGDGKTVEGFFIGTISGTVFGSLILRYFGLGGFYEAFLLSFGALTGDLIGSFVKRRVGLERGEEAPIIDQIDFIFGAFLLLPPPPEWGIIIIVVTPVLHRLANIIGYLLGVKDEPW